MYANNTEHMSLEVGEVMEVLGQCLDAPEFKLDIGGPSVFSRTECLFPALAGPFVVGVPTQDILSLCCMVF